MYVYIICAYARACLCVYPSDCVRGLACTNGSRNFHVKRKIHLSFVVCDALEESGGLCNRVQKLKGVT